MAQDSMDWGGILNQILGLAPGILGGVQAFGGGQTGALGQAERASAMADPFASQRGRYQDMLGQTLGQPGGAPNPYAAQLQGLLSDPNSFKTDPGYQFALGQGQQAIERGSNALYGTGRTGSLGPELAKYTEGYANQAYDTRINQLAGLSGNQQTYNTNLMKELLSASGADTGNPAVAGDLLMSGYTGQNRGLGAMFSGLGGNASGGGLGGLLNLLLGKGSGSGSGINFGSYATGPGAPQTGGPGGEDGLSTWEQGLNFGSYGSGPGALQLGGPGGGDGGPDWGSLFGGWGGGATDPWYG